MKSNRIFLLLMLCSLFTLTNCKKGEDDPFLSLRSRKARVVGEWTMKSGTGKISAVSGTSGASFTNNITYTETNYTETSSYPGGGSSGTHQLKITFERDGSFIYTESMDGSTFIAKGTWNFTGGIGENKRKEQLVLHVISYSDPDGSVTYAGNYTDLTYNIKELRNKKMVLISKDISSYSDGDYNSYETDYTFEQ